MTGTGVPFRSRVGSWWGLHILQKWMHTVLEGENLNQLVSAQSESLLAVTLDNMDMFRSIADQEVIDI